MTYQDPNPFNYPFRSMTDFSEDAYRPPAQIVLDPVPLGLGPTADVVTAAGRVYALVNDGLTVLDAESLAVLGRIEGLVSARQVAVNADVAVVTARESGAFVVDVSDPTSPRLAAHYDAVEFATGVDLPNPNLAILTCRHYGLEFVDISEPATPRFLSSILVGEAQSVASAGTIAYAGVWFEKELVLVDFSDPTQPEIVGRSPLDGFGDGVHVQGSLAYIAAGHHSALQRDPRNFESASHVTLDMFEKGFGVGHGVEIHDVSDPSRPFLVNRVKSPPGFCSPDTWRVISHGNLLIQADSGSGVFVYDLSNPTAPVPLASAVLPAYENFRAPRTLSIQIDRHPVTGIAVAGNSLLLAGKTTDLYRCSLPDLASSTKQRVRRRSAFPSHYPEPDVPQRAGEENLLATCGQVHSAATDGKDLLVAAGEDGFFILDPASNDVLTHQETSGFAQHIFCARGLIYVSESTGGLSVWKRDDDSSLRQIGSWRPGLSVRQVMIPESLPFGLAIIGAGELAIIDLADSANPTGAATHKLIGHAYARLLADKAVDGRYALGATQGSGLNWFDLSDASTIGVAPRSSGARLCPIVEGFTVHEGRAVVVQAGGYYFASPNEVQSQLEAEHIYEPGRFYSGVPHSIRPDRIVITNRATGSARILDVSDMRKPRTVAYLQLPGHPDRPVLVGGNLFFPCGRSGLREIPCP